MMKSMGFFYRELIKKPGKSRFYNMLGRNMMMRKDINIKQGGQFFATTAMALALMVQMPANAEEEKEAKSNLVLDEITVTATRSAENLQNIGIAVSAFMGIRWRTEGLSIPGISGKSPPV